MATGKRKRSGPAKAARKKGAISKRPPLRPPKPRPGGGRPAHAQTEKPAKK